MTKKNLFAKFKEYLPGYLFLSPNLVGFLIFVLLPVGASGILSFYSWDLFGIPKFVGLANYLQLLRDARFWEYLLNTLFFLLGIVPGMLLALVLAVLLNQKIRGVVAFRTMYFLPVVSSMVAVALVWRWIYNPDFGLLNAGLKMIGIESPPDWLSDTRYSKPALLLVTIWKGLGYNMLLYLAALQAIPDFLYEAAEVDGASSWHKFIHITLPLLAPTHFFLLVMGIIGTFQMFGEIFVMTKGGPAGSTTTLVYYIYQYAFQWFQMGYASAISWVVFAFTFTAAMVQWKYLARMREAMYY